MSSPKFEGVKQQNPALAALFDRLATYICKQSDNGQPYVIPKLAAAALKLSDSDAYVLLEALAKGGVLRHVYNVYCRRENALVATVHSLKELDELPLCDFCNTEHDPSDLKVELAFEPESDDLKDAAA